MKVKLTMKNETYYRLRILEPTSSILIALKEYWEKNNVNTNIYGEWDKVSVEIEGNTPLGHKPKLIYFFDDYQTIPYDFRSQYTGINRGLSRTLTRLPCFPPTLL